MDVLGGLEEGAVSFVEEPTDEQRVLGLLASDRAFTVREIMELTRLSEDAVIETLLRLRHEQHVRLVAAWQKT